MNNIPDFGYTHVFMFACMYVFYTHVTLARGNTTNDHHRVETWGAGVETQKNKKNLVPLFKKDKNKNSHQPRT